MSGWHWLLVGAGGSAGAIVRYGVARWFATRQWRPEGATLAVNLTGSLAAGFLLGLQWKDRNPDMFALAGTGFLGGLTTYSTLNVQKASLAAEGRVRRLGMYMTLTYAGGWTLTAVGYAAGLWIDSST